MAEIPIGNGNGSRSWDVFFKMLSLFVIPWAAFITYSIVDMRVLMGRYDERLGSIEMDVGDLRSSFNNPANRYFRSDGERIEKRVDKLEDKLEGLHPPGSKKE